MEEIIHCKECKYYHPISDLNSDCGNIHGLLSPSANDFCSYADRDENNDLDGQMRFTT